MSAGRTGSRVATIPWPCHFLLGKESKVAGMAVSPLVGLCADSRFKRAGMTCDILGGHNIDGLQEWWPGARKKARQGSSVGLCDV